MAGLVDERLAAASGVRVQKVFLQTKKLAKAEPAESSPESVRVELVPHHEHVIDVNNVSEKPKRLSLPWIESPPASSSWLPSGSLAYVIVLLVMISCVFGLEVYRIREVSHLQQRLDLLQGELELFRQEFVETIKLKNPTGINNSPMYGVRNDDTHHNWEINNMGP